MAHLINIFNEPKTDRVKGPVFFMETITKDGIVYPVLKANSNGYVTCPFCGQKHKHGKGDGHRIPDCGNSDKVGYFVTKEGFCDAKNGYFIRH